jgi:beta-phosphoglucomutase-like phosphatase (HAD superfamily)
VSTPSFIFDLDGTLIDSVYQHVIAWRGALADEGIDLAVWRSRPGLRSSCSGYPRPHR